MERRLRPPGRPETEVAACLRAQAWEIRQLNAPVRSAVGGIVAQCEVRVVFFEGPQGSESRFRALRRVNDNDRQALDQALADVTWARRCAGRQGLERAGELFLAPRLAVDKVAEARGSRRHVRRLHFLRP